MCYFGCVEPNEATPVAELRLERRLPELPETHQATSLEGRQERLLPASSIASSPPVWRTGLLISRPAAAIHAAHVHKGRPPPVPMLPEAPQGHDAEGLRPRAHSLDRK